jgi:trk system potassium uptake protein TrkA
LIAEPETIEIINFHDNDIKIVGIQVTQSFIGSGKKIHEIALLDKSWRKVRIIAVNKNNNVLIPTGNDIIEPGDRIFIIGNSESIKSVTHTYFPSDTKIKKVIIFGGNRIGKELARKESILGKKVTLVEEDEDLCSKLSEELNNVLIINGSGTNSSVLDELDMNGSFVACVTDRDEQNIITAVLAKRNGALKAVCNITNIAISQIINEIQDIDSVFSTESLALSEILNYCRRGEILSVYPIPNMKAETMKAKISTRLEILDKPLKNIQIPKGMIVGAIMRDKKIIIPYGNDDIRLGDFVICFMLPSARKAAKELFSKTSGQ